MSSVISAIKPNVKDAKARERIYAVLIPVWEGEDCDTMEEVIGEDPAYDRALKKRRAQR